MGVAKKLVWWLGIGHRSLKLNRRLKLKKQDREWFFVFFAGDERLPWYVKPFLTEGFEHVICFAQANYDVVVVDPTYRWLEAMIYSNPAGRHLVCPAEYIASDFYLQGGRVVRIKYPSDSSLTSHHFTQYFPGCVTIMKSILGVSPWCWTPFQFYRWLLENGGLEYSSDNIESILNRLQEDKAHGRW